MTDPFQTLADSVSHGAGSQAVATLIAHLRETSQFHQLFDALLLQQKLAWGLPLLHPTSFDDVPEPQKAEFEQAYIAAAREVGSLLLQAGQLGQAWVYFRTLREPEPVIAAINALDLEQPPPEDLYDVALYQGVAPERGLEFLLKYNGTCNSITALDQQFRQLTPQQRRACAALMVRQIHRDLHYSVLLDIERRTGQPPAAETSLTAAIAAHPELLAEGNYHIDVSHLHAVVRFARTLTRDDAELLQARELAEYGSRLLPQYQYAADPPFEAYYPAHIAYFSALAGDNPEHGLHYFEQNLQSQTEDMERQLSALGYVELLMRLDHKSRAAELGVKHLGNVQDQIGFSLSDLCLEAHRPELLPELARAKQDLVAYTAALLTNAPTRGAS